MGYFVGFPIPFRDVNTVEKAAAAMDIIDVINGSQFVVSCYVVGVSNVQQEMVNKEIRLICSVKYTPWKHIGNIGRFVIFPNEKLSASAR